MKVKNERKQGHGLEYGHRHELGHFFALLISLCFFHLVSFSFCFLILRFRFEVKQAKQTFLFCFKAKGISFPFYLVLASNENEWCTLVIDEEWIWTLDILTGHMHRHFQSRSLKVLNLIHTMYCTYRSDLDVR